MGLQETVRLRERQRQQKARGRNRDRDRDLMSQSKRRRVERYSQRSKDLFVEDGGVEDSSTEGSFEDDYKEDDATSLSFSKSNHASRRTITPTRTLRPFPVLRVADEMIGVPVPRKARSALVKRSNEHWNSVTGGFLEEQIYRRLSPLPVSRRVDTVSPSSSSLPPRKKMKPFGPRIKIPKVSRKPLRSVQEDIEIEVVEALFDLMKQSQSQSQSQTSKKAERNADNNSSGKLDSISKKADGNKSKYSPVQSAQITPETSYLPPYINDIPTSLLDVGLKRKGTDYGKDEENSVVLVKEGSRIAFNTSNEEPIKVESKISFSRLEKTSSGLVERTQELVGSDWVVVSKEEEFRSSAKSNADDSVDSSVSKANLMVEVVESKKEAKLEIDLMAPPPMPLSQERDGFAHLVSDCKFLGFDVQMKRGTLVANEDSVVAGKVAEEKKMVTVNNQQEFSDLDLERRPQPDKVSSSRGIKTQKSVQKKPTPPTQNFVTSCPGGFPYSGYMPPVQTIMPDGSARSSTQFQFLQIAPFSPSQPLPKRCLTHQYIACSIRYHQQLSKTCMGPAACSATLYGAKGYDANITQSSPNSLQGKPLEGDSTGRQVLATIPALRADGKSLRVANMKDAPKSKQLVPADNLPQGPAFIFPLGQHLVASVPATQSEPAKSAAVAVKASSSNNSSVVPPVSTSSFLTGPTALSFNCSNLPANETPPFMTILQNSGHPYSISLMPLQYKGAQASIFPFFNASFCPSVFHITQNQSQHTSQPQSDALHQVQQVSQTSGRSSSNKQKNQEQMGNQTSDHSSLHSSGMQLQQSQKQSQASIKLDKEMRRQETAAGNNRVFCAQNGQNSAIQIQPMDFAPHGALGSGGSNHLGNQQQQGSKHAVELIPAQRIGLPFRTSTTPSLNFPSASQHTELLQMLPDVGQQGYQFVPLHLAAKHKNFLASEEKIIINSSGNDDGKRPIMGKSIGQSLSFSTLSCGNSSTSTVKEIAADGSTQARSCLASTVIGNEPSASTSNAATATFSIDTQKSHSQQEHQELIHLQKQHIQQLQSTGTALVKAQASNNSPNSSIGSNFPNNNPIFFQALVHNNRFVQSSHWTNASFAMTSQVPSLATTSSLKILPQQEWRNSHGQQQISFGSSSNSSTKFQGQQLMINSQRTASIVDGSTSNSSPTKNTSGSSSKTRPTVAAQPPKQTETSSNGPSQKSSPVCGRNVPSILSSCPSQLSELKY